MTEEKNGTELVSTGTEVSLEAEREPQPPIESRFLYIRVASKRVQQLRRGALPRLEGLMPDAETGIRPDLDTKLERVAMREVDDGLVVYELPEPKAPGEESA